MSQAIAQTADRVYHSLSPMEQTQVRNIFVRLTRLDESAIPGEKRLDTRHLFWVTGNGPLLFNSRGFR